MASSLIKKAYASYTKAQAAKKKYERKDINKYRQLQKERIKEINETTERNKNSAANRGLTSLITGFQRGMSYVPDVKDKNETFGDAYFRTRYPEEAKKLQKGINEARAKRDKAIFDSKEGKTWGTVGSAAGTITGAIMTGGITKGIAKKALGTNAAKKLTGRIAEKTAQKAIADKAGKTLTRKALSNMAKASSRKVTETSLRNASKKLTGKIAENIAQDVAYDTTFGAAKDVSSYISSGKNPLKNKGDFAKYMAKNAGLNLVYGAIGNAVLPTVGAIKGSKNLYKTVERIGTDGEVHKVKVLKNAPQRVKSVRNRAGEAADILSPKLKAGKTQSIKGTADNLTYQATRNAMNDAQYVDEIRRNGINGKTVRQVAAEQNRSVADVIAEDYAKRRGVSLENLNRLRRNAADLGDDVTATGNKIAHKPGRAASAEAPEASTPPVTGAPVTATEQAVTRKPDLTEALAEKRRATEAQGATTPTPIVEPPKQAVQPEINIPQTPPSATTQAAQPTSNVPLRQTTQADQIDTSMGGMRTGTEAGRSQAADTITQSKGWTKEESKELNDYLVDTKADRTWSESNKEALDNMARRVDEDGVEASAVSLRRKFEDNQRWTNEDTAETIVLRDRLEEKKQAAALVGDTGEVKRITQQQDQLSAINGIEASEAGKTLQAQKEWQRLTPEGREYAANMLGVRMGKKLGVKIKKVDRQLYDNLRNAKTEQEIQKAKDAIAVAYWDQIPPNITEKLSAWRYLSMLGNPKTHIRNIVGNTAFMAPRAIKNALATAIEPVFLKKADRTKAIVNPLTDSPLFKKAGEEWDSVKDTFMNGSEKFESLSRRPEGSAVFKFKPLQKLSDFNAYWLTKEDEVFAGIAYKNAYAGFLKAKGIDPSKASEAVLKKARDYAWDEALTATYREPNMLATAINKARAGANISMRDFHKAKNGKEMEELLLKKGAGTLVDALVPFAKTPANILKQGIDYSPISFLRLAGKLTKAKTAENVIDNIDTFAQGVTGTGLMVAGYLLAKHGGVTSSIESGYDTVKQRLGTYNKDRGEQDYSFIINGKAFNKFDLFNQMNSEKEEKQWNVTGDSLVPAALPFFQGVELYNALEGWNDPDISAGDRLMQTANVAANMMKLTDPVMNLSMLSSVQNAFDTWQSKGAGTSAITSFILNSLQSRLGQYVPTVGGQFVNTMRDAKPSASPTNSGLIGDWESFGRQMANKVPGLTNINADKSDAFGQKVEGKKDHSAETYIKSGLKNFISPFNIREMRNTPADKELQRLVNEEGQSPKNLLPEVQKASYITNKFGETEYKVTQKDVAHYNELHGQYALEHINSLIETNTYKKATSEEKANMIKGVYKEATAYADETLAKEKGASDRDILLSDQYYVQKEKNLGEVGVKKDKAAKIYKSYNDTRAKLQTDGVTKGGGRYVTEALAAVEGGVKNYDQAKAVTSQSFSESNWRKTYNLAKAGYTAKQCRKLALRDDEYEKLVNYNRNGRSTGIDNDKLAAYVNKKKVSQREKWAIFELNKKGDAYNPF